jgi:WD40 repeat protein
MPPRGLQQTFQKGVVCCPIPRQRTYCECRTESPSGKPFLICIQIGHDVVRAVAYCPNGRKVATCGHDCTIKIWDDAGVLLTTLTGHTERVVSVVWTKDGNRIISRSTDGTVRVWDPQQKMECITPVSDSLCVIQWPRRIRGELECPKNKGRVYEYRST